MSCKEQPETRQMSTLSRSRCVHARVEKGWSHLPHPLLLVHHKVLVLNSLLKMCLARCLFLRVVHDLVLVYMLQIWLLLGQ